MAVDLTNAGAAVFASATASFYVNYPASVDSFQFLLMQISVRDTSTTPTVSASWVSIAADSTLTGRQFLYYRWGTTTFAGSSTTVAFAASTVVKGGRIYGFSGIATASTIYEGGQYMTSNTTSMTCGEVTSTVASFTTLGVAAYHVNDDNDVGDFAGAVGATWAKKYQASTTLGSDGTIGIEVCTITAIATVTTASYSMAAADPWGVRTFLLIGSSTISQSFIPLAMYDYRLRRV